MTILYSAAVKRAAIFMALCGLCAGPVSHCPGAIVEFPIPNNGVGLQDITYGPDGAYWFTEFGANRVARVDTNGVFLEYPTPTGGSRPYGITTGPDGAIWFTEAATSMIGRVDTNFNFQEFKLPFTTTLTGITVGPDGRLWMTDFGVEAIPGQQFNGGIIAVTISNSMVTQSVYYWTNMTYGSRPVSITSGPDGNLYFTEQHAGQIGRITTNGVISEVLVSDGTTQPIDITTGPDGAMWFTQVTINALGRIDPANFTNVMIFPLPANISGLPDQLNGIALGKDGNLYYADSPGNFLGQVIVTGTNLTVNQYYTPTTNSSPWRVAAGADGNVWFGELTANAIGKFLQPVSLMIGFTNSNIVLSWSTNVGTNFVLEENTSVNNPTNWTFVTNVPATNGSLFTVTIPTTNGASTNGLFFRLID